MDMVKSSISAFENIKAQIINFLMKQPNSKVNLRSFIVHSQKKRCHRAPFCYKKVLERSAPARVQMIGTFGKSKVRDANLPAGLRCPPSRGAGCEPKIVLKGDHTRNLRIAVDNFSRFQFCKFYRIINSFYNRFLMIYSNFFFYLIYY